MNIDKYDLFRMHPVSRGLSEAGARAILDHLELVRCDPGDVIHRANEVVSSVFFLVHGRLSEEIQDPHGNVVMSRFILPGGIFGALAAAMNEPAPLDCSVVDPSTLFKLDYQRALELYRTWPQLQSNLMQLVAVGVKQAILRERQPHQPRAVCFFHQSDATRAMTRRLFERLAGLGDRLALLSDRPAGPAVAGIQHFRVIGGDAPMPMAEVHHLLPDWMREGRVIGDVDATIDPEIALRAFERFDWIFWCVTPANQAASVANLRKFLAHAPSWRDKVYLVWLLENEQFAPVAGELRELARHDLKVSFTAPQKNQGRMGATGFERLLHLMRGIKIGVALGGGAARGMAHLGVLKALEDNGIVVDMIAGTSAGAMSGTLYASGLDADFLTGCFVRDMRPGWIFRMLPGGDQWYLLYKYRRGQFDPMLRKYLGPARLEQFPVPMRTITVDLISGKTIVRDSGDAVHSILESINLPGLAKPINRDGQSLVDGGLIDNVPADVLASSGCNFIIAVSVTAKMETEFAKNRSNTPTSDMRSASTVQTLLRSFLVQSFSINAIGVEPADFVIEPDVTAFQLTEFTRTDELAAVGEKATVEALPRIRDLLHRLDARLFPSSP